MRIKHRIEDRRKPQITNTSNTNINSNKSLKDINDNDHYQNEDKSITPSRQRKVNVGMVYNKTFIYGQGQTMLDYETAQNKSISPYKIAKHDMPL